MAGNTLSLGISNAGPIASIINFYSSGGVQSGGTVHPIFSNGMREVLAGGAYVANTLQTVISHTGRGSLNLLSVYSKDATPRTLRCRITIDGVVVFDATSSSISSGNFGIVPVGVTNNSGSIEFQRVEYNESLLIEVASSLGEAAANIGIGVNRETWVS